MIKLHVGCGRVIKDGYVNIDTKGSKGLNHLIKIADCESLPYEGGSVDVIESYHMIEHLDRHKALRVIKHWFELLKPGGRLITECPNFQQAAKEYLEGDISRIDNLFGLQRNEYDFHRFGYTSASLEKIMKEIGFTRFLHEPPTDYHANDEPCLRIVAFK